MVNTKSSIQSVIPQPWLRRDWINLFWLISFAAVLRLILFNGFFGSDDLVYLDRSIEIAQGVWTSADYNGALRYGYNIPAALFIYLFGLNIYTANAWAFLCSLAEIAVVYFFATQFLNRQVAILAALLLATIPLHIALATRIHADSVMAFFLTLSFVLFCLAEHSGRRLLYFAAGLAMGMIFWVKELGVITLLVFASYPILVRRLDRNWWYVIAGGLIMLIGHLILMQIIAGDPLHLIKTVTGQVERGFIHGGIGADSPGYYFWYLFVDIKHTWFAPLIAAVALIWVFIQRRHTHPTLIYIAWWLLGLLIILSFLPVSLSPLRFALKQSNYLNLFLAPIVLLCASLLRSVSGFWPKILTTVVLVGGILLGALEQQAYQNFTANSRAAVVFLKSQPDEWMVGSTNNGNWARIYALLDQDPSLVQRFGYFLPDGKMSLTQIRSVHGFALFDWETMYWGSSTKLDKVPVCWEEVEMIQPSPSGLGRYVLSTVGSISNMLPPPLNGKVAEKIHMISTPKSATIYRVDANNLDCKMADSRTN